MPEPDADTPKVETKKILFSNVFHDGTVELAESVDQNGNLILWVLDPDTNAAGMYDYPEHEDPNYPIRYTAVGQRLMSFSPASPGRCNATRADGGHCRMPEGRCRFHDSATTLF